MNITNLKATVTNASPKGRCSVNPLGGNTYISESFWDSRMETIEVELCLMSRVSVFKVKTDCAKKFLFLESYILGNG